MRRLSEPVGNSFNIGDFCEKIGPLISPDVKVVHICSFLFLRVAARWGVLQCVENCTFVTLGILLSA